MYERLFSADPVTGKRTVFHADADGENYTLHTRMDVTPIIDHNQALRSHHASRHSGRIFDSKKFMTHIASIPAFLFFDLKKRGILSADGTEILDEKKFSQFLNDNEWLKFRTHEGKV
jgi:hypothetical protein